MYRCDLCALCFDNKWWSKGQTTCSHDHDVYQMPHMTSVQRTESIEWVEKPSCRWVVLSLSSHQEKGWCIGHSHLVWSNCMWIVYVYVCVCVCIQHWKHSLKANIIQPLMSFNRRNSFNWEFCCSGPALLSYFYLWSDRIVHRTPNQYRQMKRRTYAIFWYTLDIVSLVVRAPIHGRCVPAGERTIKSVKDKYKC